MLCYNLNMYFINEDKNEKIIRSIEGKTTIDWLIMRTRNIAYLVPWHMGVYVHFNGMWTLCEGLKSSQVSSNFFYLHFITRKFSKMI